MLAFWFNLFWYSYCWKCIAQGIITKNQYYDPSSKIAIEPSADFVPNIMYDFIMWLTNDYEYRNVSNCEKVTIGKNELSVLSICHGIIPKPRHVHTPLILGLGLYVHHEWLAWRFAKMLCHDGWWHDMWLQSIRWHSSYSAMTTSTQINLTRNCARQGW